MHLGDFLTNRGWQIIPNDSKADKSPELWERDGVRCKAYDAQKMCWFEEWQWRTLEDGTLACFKRELQAKEQTS
jgi:hypothetical protein